MMDKALNFLRRAFPYLLAIALWRLSVPVWNPAGVLAIIPVFFCAFVRPVPLAGIFGVLICFLIDYKFDSVLFWTTMFLIFYAINGFQTFVDLTRADKNAMDVFMIFFWNMRFDFIPDRAIIYKFIPWNMDVFMDNNTLFANNKINQWGAS